MGREGKRRALLAVGKAVHHIMTSGTDEAEAHATLLATTVVARAATGLCALPFPAPAQARAFAQTHSARLGTQFGFGVSSCFGG